MHTYVHSAIHTRINICTHACMYTKGILCTWVCMHVFVYIYTYTQIHAHMHVFIPPKKHRYDAIIHMVTAADGAEHHYNLSSNEEGVRTETPEQAKELDKKTSGAWSRYAHVGLCYETYHENVCNMGSHV